MKTSITRWIAPAVVTLMLAGPAFGAGGISTAPRVSPPVAETTVPAPNSGATAATAPGTAADYAARERQAASAGLENWKGGASLSITLGTTALVVLLAVVLLLVLL
jgi:hypothetical protein